MKLDLSGKTALVTGGSRGIGEAIVKSLHNCGADIAIHFVNNSQRASQILDQIDGRGRTYQANLENPEEVEKLFTSVTTDFDTVDILVNNAGIAILEDPEASIENFVASWRKTMAVNLEATGILCKMSIEHFRRNGGGKIINISSRAAFRGDTKEYLAYAASKGGVVALTRSIARAYGKDGIVAFNIAPGFVRTDMAQDFIDEYGEDLVLNDIALPKLTEPTDVGPMVAFLASGLADHATGATIDINAASYVH